MPVSTSHHCGDDVVFAHNGFDRSLANNRDMLTTLEPAAQLRTAGGGKSARLAASYEFLCAALQRVNQIFNRLALRHFASSAAVGCWHRPGRLIAGVHFTGEHLDCLA